MKSYSYKQDPIRVFGVPHFEKTGELRRLSDELLEQLPLIRERKLGLRTPGARIAFRTDSANILIKMTVVPTFDIAMSVWATAAAYVYVGDRSTMRYAGYVAPKTYDDAVFEGNIRKAARMEDVTIYLPRNVHVDDVEITLQDAASIEAPTPYRYERPIVFYGSSITEGGCAALPTNAYTAIVARHLDADHINLGFSGSAQGELCLADFINTLDMSVFVLDYDNNAPTPDHLQKTHEPFFLRIREKHPELPIVMITRPQVHPSEDADRRRKIIRTTYENALARGDNNVYFIDGAQFVGEVDRQFCTVDGVHPNDLGFAHMAAIVESVIRGILEK